MAIDDSELDFPDLDKHRAEWERNRPDEDDISLTVYIGHDGTTSHAPILPDSIINPTLRDQQERALAIMEGYVAEVRYALHREEPFAPPTGYYWETNVIDPLCWADG